MDAAWERLVARVVDGLVDGRLDGCVAGYSLGLVLCPVGGWMGIEWWEG